MHLLQKYGSTYREVQKDGYKNTYVAFEQVMTDNMSCNLGVVLMNLARYAEQIKPDMIVVHGDRIDALLASEKNYIVVYPNNDNGQEIILNEIGRLYGNKRFRFFPSIRFEYFLAF